MMPLQLKGLLELTIKRSEFFPGSRFLSLRIMTEAEGSDVNRNKHKHTPLKALMFCWLLTIAVWHCQYKYKRHS